MSSPSLTGYSANNPKRYLGPAVAIPVIVVRNREPTGADIRQPNTGKYYSFGTFWLVGETAPGVPPTTGLRGDLWYLSKIIANVAFWVQLTSSSSSSTFNVSTNIQIYDDFVSYTLFDINLLSAYPWLLSSAIINQLNSPDSNHPGVIGFEGGFSGGGILMESRGSVGKNIILGGGEITLTWIVKIAVPSTPTNRYVLSIGLGDTRLSLSYANGCYFSYSDDLNSGNFVLNTTSASITTATNTITLADTEFHNFTMVINASATAVTFFIDGLVVGVNTTNIPITGLAPFVEYVVTAGTAPENCVLIDCVYLNQTFTTPR